MEINYTGHHLIVTPALKNMVAEKLQKLERHCEKINTVKILFRIENLDQIVEATAFGANTEIHADAKTENMYTSIDKVVDRLDKQLMKKKEKRLDKQHHED